MKILVIEDDIPMQTILARILRDGNQINCTGSLYAGMEIAKLEQPDLILLDLVLLDSSAENTVNQIPDIIAASPDSAIVVITGHSSEQIVNKAKKLGAAGVAEKGVRMSSVNAVLQEITDVLCEAGDRYDRCKKYLSKAMGCQL